MISHFSKLLRDKILQTYQTGELELNFHAISASFIFKAPKEDDQCLQLDMTSISLMDETIKCKLLEM
jgi:hypothetical protein